MPLPSLDRGRDMRQRDSTSIDKAVSRRTLQRLAVPCLLACCVACAIFQSRLAVVHEEVSHLHENIGAALTRPLSAPTRDATMDATQS